MINKQNTIGDNTRSEDTASMHSDRDDSSEGDAISDVEVESPLCECDINKFHDSHIVLQQLSRDDKYRILTTEPNSDPSANTRTRPYQTSSLRQVQPSWMKQYPWLHYSKFADGAFCRACALFAPSTVSGQDLG